MRRGRMTGLRGRRMTEHGLLIDVDDRGVATLTLNRPDKHNAFDDRLIAAMTDALVDLGARPDVRCVLLTGAGRSFSAGADLGWMKSMAAYSEAENLADAKALARLMHTLDTVPKPTIALVNGPAYGGGVGLVAACDIAIATDQATFSLSEVRLGLIPAVISPFVVAAIGARAARRYFQTAERFSALEAKSLGLVHEVVGSVFLSAAGEKIVGTLLDGGPIAQAEAKALIRAVNGQEPCSVLDQTAAWIARLRVDQEGQEGLTAFLQKRPPAWRSNQT